MSSGPMGAGALRWNFYVIIPPNVTIGKGSVVSAGSVVNQSVPPGTVVQGNPAQPVARFAMPLAWRSYETFMQNLSPIEAPEQRRSRDNIA
jgi:UDP-3-O-[3-hydroxymyristoyl] glucosamine N-acyltransferase